MIFPYAIMAQSNKPLSGVLRGAFPQGFLYGLLELEYGTGLIAGTLPAIPSHRHLAQRRISNRSAGMTKPAKERRGKRRVTGIKGLAIGLDSQTSAAAIIDISLSGVRFLTQEPVEFMTKLMMTLIISGDGSAPKASGTGVKCEGAVVRCEPAGSGEDDKYEVAVFFTHLDEEAEKTIGGYVHAH
jgi:hypothetical protein